MHLCIKVAFGAMVLELGGSSVPATIPRYLPKCYIYWDKRASERKAFGIHVPDIHSLLSNASAFLPRIVA